jgi:hypothetical protein
MRKKKKNKNPMAKELRKPQYQKKIIPNKKRHEMECRNNFYRDFDDALFPK